MHAHITSKIDITLLREFNAFLLENIKPEKRDQFISGKAFFWTSPNTTNKIAGFLKELHTFAATIAVIAPAQDQTTQAENKNESTLDDVQKITVTQAIEKLLRVLIARHNEFPPNHPIRNVFNPFIQKIKELMLNLACFDSKIPMHSTYRNSECDKNGNYDADIVINNIFVKKQAAIAKNVALKIQTYDTQLSALQAQLKSIVQVTRTKVARLNRDKFDKESQRRQNQDELFRLENPIDGIIIDLARQQEQAVKHARNAIEALSHQRTETYHEVSDSGNGKEMKEERTQYHAEPLFDDAANAIRELAETAKSLGLDLNSDLVLATTATTTWTVVTGSYEEDIGYRRPNVVEITEERSGPDIAARKTAISTIRETIEAHFTGKIAAQHQKLIAESSELQQKIKDKKNVIAQIDTEIDALKKQIDQDNHPLIAVDAFDDRLDKILGGRIKLEDVSHLQKLSQSQQLVQIENYLQNEYNTRLETISGTFTLEQRKQLLRAIQQNQLPVPAGSLQQLADELKKTQTQAIEESSVKMGVTKTIRFSM